VLDTKTQKVLNNSTIRNSQTCIEETAARRLIKRRSDSISLFQRAQVVYSKQRDLLFRAKWLHLPFPGFYCGYSFNFSS